MKNHLSEKVLLDGLEHIKNSPSDHGILELIVIRPRENERLVLNQCALSSSLGVHGDGWAVKCWKTLQNGSSDPDVQVALMNSRCVALLSQNKSRWPLAGDNLYLDLDLSADNLSCGQKLAIGSVILQVTSQSHNGCGKFAQRYGKDAVKFVNSPIGKQLHLRGIYARIIRDGFVKVGDSVKKITE